MRSVGPQDGAGPSDGAAPGGFGRCDSPITGHGGGRARCDAARAAQSRAVIVASTVNGAPGALLLALNGASM